MDTSTGFEFAMTGDAAKNDIATSARVLTI
jgi:hypothetical protein